jgi:hypothetical protein
MGSSNADAGYSAHPGVQRQEIRLNGVRYCWPDRPVVVVCNDGGDPAYLDRALEEGIVPNVARFMETGFSAIAQSVIPSFTCPNNVSIVTGSPPSIHGISGNFYLEPETGNAVAMTGPELMRSTTILAEFSRKGAKVVSITAKDKLRPKPRSIPRMLNWMSVGSEFGLARDRQEIEPVPERWHPMEEDANETATRYHRAGLRVASRPSPDSRRDPRHTRRIDRARPVLA